MKKRLQMGLWGVLALGGLGMALRFWLFAAGVDEKGLFPASHSAIWLCYVLTALMAALVIATLFPMNPKPRYERNFPASKLSAAGCAAAAAGLAVFGILELRDAGDGLSRICGVFALLAAASMAISAFCRLRGIRLHFALGLVLCLFSMLALYCRYRQWSSEPQLSLYFYALLALVCSMLSCYYRTALDGDVGKLRPFLGMSLAALFFCCLAVPGTGDFPLYLGLGAYFTGELLALRLPRRAKQKPEEA